MMMIVKMMKLLVRLKMMMVLWGQSELVFEEL